MKRAMGYGLWALGRAATRSLLRAGLAVLSVAMAASVAFAQMPDAKQMSGIPRPVTDLPNGSVSVRVIRGDMTQNLANQPVEMRSGDKVQTVNTDAEGRAQFDNLTPGSPVKFATVVDGERIESQEFPAQSPGGVRLLLVATDPNAKPTPAAPAVPAVAGTVSIGGESRMIVETDEESVTVYYLLDIVNSAAAPVIPPTPFVFTLPVAARAILPHLKPDGYVASFQNGLNELVIADVVGKARTVGAFLNFGADYMSPGVIHFGGRGAVVLGELDSAMTPRLHELHALMQVFEPDAVAVPDIYGYLWGKLGYGALLFATALTNASICDALGAQSAHPLYVAIAREATGVAAAMQISPRGFNGYEPAAFAPGAPPAEAEASFAAMVAHNAKSAKTHSGIWRDLAVRKRKTEVDAQLGPIVEFGARQSLATPATQELIAMIHEIEDGARPLDWGNLAELARKAGAG